MPVFPLNLYFVYNINWGRPLPEIIANSTTSTPPPERHFIESMITPMRQI